jgi:hypothetical protein
MLDTLARRVALHCPFWQRAAVDQRRGHSSDHLVGVCLLGFAATRDRSYQTNQPPKLFVSHPDALVMNASPMRAT